MFKLQVELLNVINTSPGCLVSPRWRRPVLDFRTNLDKDFIGFEYSLEADILVANISWNYHFVGVKKRCYFGMNFSFMANALIIICSTCLKSVVNNIINIPSPLLYAS